MINKTWTSDKETRLDLFLREKLADLPELSSDHTSNHTSNSKIRRLIMAGCILVNSKQCRVPSFNLRQGSRVQAMIDEAKFFYEKQPDDIDFTLTQKDVLYEDQDIIVVNKPAFFPSEETMVKGRGNMHQAVIDWLWKKNPSLRNPPYVGIMHRLDRETSGVLLFTKTRTVNAAVHDMFQNHTAKKTYRAVCTALPSAPKKYQEPGASFTVENYIGRISPKSSACKIGALPESRGGQWASTDFKITGVQKKYIHVDCFLHTGRTHQIRVHLSQSGLPISGDTLYGGDNGFRELNGRIMLHAMSLEFPHPVTGITMKVEAPLPEYF